MKNLGSSLLVIILSNLLFFGCVEDEIKTEINFKDPVISLEEDSTVTVTIRSNALFSSKDTIYLVMSGGTAVYDDDFTTDVPFENGMFKVFGTGKSETTFQVHAVYDLEQEGEEFAEFEIVKFTKGVRHGLHEKVRLNITDKQIHTVSFSGSAGTVAEGDDKLITLEASRVLTPLDTIHISALDNTIESVDLQDGGGFVTQFKVVGNNSATVSFNLSALNDCEFEESESMTFEISRLSEGLVAGTTDSYSFQIEDHESGSYCLSFDGVDDFINLGNIYDDLELPFTIEAWVYVMGSDSYASPVFTSQDNLPLYNGFQFIAGPTTIAIEYGDGMGENNTAYRRGKAATVSNISNTWVHVAGIIRGRDDMDVFLNGINVGGSYSGSTYETMNSDSPNDVAKIGYWYSNGLVSRFKGKIDEVRIWNHARSTAEIRANMCGELSGTENGLIGYWPFNETEGSTVYDQSPNLFHGTLMGSPARTPRLTP